MDGLAQVNGEFFVSVAGIGISTQIHREVPEIRKRRWGPLAYALEGIQQLARSQGFWAEVRVGDQRVRTRALQITVCNGKWVFWKSCGCIWTILERQQHAG
jgi:diacylglycerol kinase family enzyme